MADIELVVKMPEEVYRSIINGKNYISHQEYVEEAIKNGCIVPIKIDNHIYDAIRNGKVLPKGHGELRDTTTIVDKLTDTDIYLTDEDWNEIGKALRSAEVLVEADKGEE